MRFTAYKDFTQFSIGMDPEALQYRRGELPDLAALIELQNSLEPTLGRLSPRARFFGTIVLMSLLAACARVDNSRPNPDVKPMGTPTSIGPDTTAPTATLSVGETLVVPPGTSVVELPSQQEFGTTVLALPGWVSGDTPTGLPDGLKPTAWDSASYASVRQHGLVPVLEGGVVANYGDSNGLVYAPELAQISSEDGTVLSPVGGVQPGGIMEYASLDGKVKRYVRAGIACPEGFGCLQAVSYNGEDAGGLYWLMLDQDTGEIISYSPAVTKDEPGRAEWLPVGDRWSSALSGPTALQAGEGYGIDYRQSVDGATNIFYFAAGDKEYQAKDREIHYTPTDKRLWVENESGIFLFDNTTHEWTRVAEQGTQMIEVGDEQMIIADEAWHTVESIDDSSGVQIVTTQDGQKWVWGQEGWEQYVTPILADLDYDASDHKNYGPEFYTIETREWQGQQVRMLIHDDPSVEGQRIDGMEVMIDGELRWVRGLWYPTTAYPGSGGIVLDMPVSPGTDLATYFREENGPNSVYGQFLRAIAHQRGIPESQIWDYIVEHDYKIKIRLPNRANGSSYSPSLLTESELVEVDLSQPFYRSNRAEVNLGQAVNGVVLTDLPETALFLFGDSRERSGWFVDASGALNLIRFDYEGSMITGRAEHVSGALFNELEILAAMTDGFSDAGDFGPNQWLEKYVARTGANYREGITVLDRDIFTIYNSGFTEFIWSVFERK